MNKQLVIIGASGHGKVIADIAKKNGYTNISFLDDNPEVRFCGAYEVVGKSSDALLLKNSDFIVAIGNSKTRCRIQTELMAQGLRVVSLVHPAAAISTDVEIGIGTVVMAGAVINPYSKIGDGCIINTCSSVDHDCQIGDYAHVSVGAHIAGTVTIGDNSWIGAGATVINNVNVISDCIVGAGAVVIKDITTPGTYIGVPAKKIIQK